MSEERGQSRSKHPSLLARWGTRASVQTVMEGTCDSCSPDVPPCLSREPGRPRVVSAHCEAGQHALRTQGQEGDLVCLPLQLVKFWCSSGPVPISTSTVPGTGPLSWGGGCGRGQSVSHPLSLWGAHAPVFTTVSALPPRVPSFCCDTSREARVALTVWTGWGRLPAALGPPVFCVPLCPPISSSGSSRTSSQFSS